MKKLIHFLSIGFLLLATVIVVSSCDNDVEAPAVAVDPSFTVTATTVQLQGGGEGLQFFATSGNVDVKMAKVVISDPISSPKDTFNLNNTYFAKNKSFGLQNSNEAYLKQIGTWKFNFVGIRPADNAAFAVDATLVVNN